MTPPTTSTVTDEMCRVAMAAYDKGCNGYYAQAPSMRAALEAALDGMVVVPVSELTYIADESGERTIREKARAMISAATPQAQGE